MKAVIIAFLMTLTSMAYSATSAENRANLKYEADVHYGWDYAMMTTQVSFGRFLSDKSLLSFKTGQASDGDRRQYAASLQYKYFFSNSFYVAPELFYLNYSEEFEVAKDTRWTTIGGHIRIGNQWQWESFTLGVDWIGIGDGLLFINNEGETVDIPQQTATFANLYIGYSF